jgi:hypothetical protein
VNGDRNASAVCNDHDLAAFAAFGLADPCAPFLAGTKVPTKVASMKHSDRSIWPRAYRSSAKVFRIWMNTLAFTQAWKWRWHVEPGEYQLGMSAQAAPVRMIQKMPFITSRGWCRNERFDQSPLFIRQVHCCVTSSSGDTVLPFLR